MDSRDVTMKSIACLSLLALLLAASLSCPAWSLFHPTWIELRTPHFDIFSELSKVDSIKAAKNLENFRSLVMLLAPTKWTGPEIPTYIYLFSEGNSHVHLEGDRWGYFIPTMRANYAAINGLHTSMLTDMLYHEYTHYVLSNMDARQYPAWFQEGFAWLLTSVRIKDHTVEIGRIPQSMGWALFFHQWLNFRIILGNELIPNGTDEQSAMFEAQSWALMHYLTMGPNYLEFNADLKDYFHLLGAGVSPLDAFTQAFKMDVNQIEPVIRSYIRGSVRYWHVTLNHPLADAQITITPMSPDLIAEKTGELVEVSSSFDNDMSKETIATASSYFEKALKANSNYANAMGGLARMKTLSGDFADAERLLDDAVRIDPQNPLHELDYGEYLVYRGDQDPQLDERREWFSKAREHLQRTLALDPKNAEALAAEGHSYLLPGEAATAGLDKLMLASSYLPGDPSIKLLLAEAYAIVGMQGEAKDLAETLISSENKRISGMAVQLLKQIEANGGPNVHASDSP